MRRHHGGDSVNRNIGILRAASQQGIAHRDQFRRMPRTRKPCKSNNALMLTPAVFAGPGRR